MPKIALIGAGSVVVMLGPVLNGMLTRRAGHGS